MTTKLQKAKEIVERQKNSYKQKVEKIQSTCNHVHIGYMENTFHDGYGQPARRICMECGYEEVGSTWSGKGTWSLSDYSATPKLSNKPGRYIIEVTDDEFFSYRS